jgi:hypothetical protein
VYGRVNRTMTYDYDSIPRDAEPEMQQVLDGVVGCVERGEGQGKCHVFFVGADVCECGTIDLRKERMR